ncbi:S8 family serine peptidase [Anaerolineales bacterium HSG24]|nr:S8 family serine peptidase [Anaerolineales bacterium HSG24]
MSNKLRPILVYVMIMSFLLTACEVQRPSSHPPDVEKLGEATTVPPVIGVTPDSSAASIIGDDIELTVHPAPEAPPQEAVEVGRLLIKLVPETAESALENEISGQSTGGQVGVAGLDELLQQIGAIDVELVVADVANATNSDTEIMSGEAEEAGKLFAISIPPEADPVAMASIVSQSPEVEYAEPNYIAGISGSPIDLPLHFTPNDPYYSLQWNLQVIQMPIAWDRSAGNGIIVAIIDTGIDFRAPDFANTQRMVGYDFVNSDEDPTDDQGHGTHVAGTVAQSTNNGLGVAGVAYNATLLPVKALDDKGQGSYETIIKGIIYAVDQGAKVINLSLAGRNPSQALEDAVKYAHDKGVVVVVAAGNSGSEVQFPAAYNNYVTSVGATTFDNLRAVYSNFGPEIDIVAPGGDVQADQNGDGFGDGILQQTFRSDGQGYSYRFFEGTSMASPHVAGVAAIMMALNPNATPVEIETAMLQTAFPLSNIVEPFGGGLIQADAAIQAIAGTAMPTVMPPTTEPPTAMPEPPTTEPPTMEPPTAEPPTMEPPTMEPPTIEPPTIEPPTTEPPTAVPPTVTPVLPPPPPGSNLLVNAGFETDEAWLFGDTPVKAEYDSSVVLSGSRSVRMGNTSGNDLYSYTSVWQKMTIPTEATQAELTVNVYRTTQDCCKDFQQILILNDRFRVVRTLMRELSNNQQWESLTYDVSEMSGQTIYVYLGVFNAGRTGQFTTMYADDISLTWQ